MQILYLSKRIVTAIQIVCFMLLKRKEIGSLCHMSYVIISSVFSGLLLGGELNFLNVKNRTIYTAL